VLHTLNNLPEQGSYRHMRIAAIALQKWTLFAKVATKSDL